MGSTDIIFMLMVAISAVNFPEISGQTGSSSSSVSGEVQLFDMKLFRESDQKYCCGVNNPEFWGCFQGLVGFGFIDGYFIIFPDLLGRNLLQTNNVSQPMRQKDDTVRVDPLDNLNKYRGGFDITNKHYWSSTVFTGIYGYAIGVFWLLSGVVYGGFLLSSFFCCKSRRKGKLKKRASCHKHCYLWPILLAAFFTILAVAASGLVLGGNAKFNSRARTVVDIVINTANEASASIFNVAGAMRGMEINLGSNLEINQATAFLTSTSEKLDVGAANIERQARKNRRLIDKGLKIVYAITTVTISLNLVAVIALSVSGILRLRRALYLLITLCWFLTFLCWLLFGVYYFLENFASDTCTALENFQQNPSNSSLSSILPCDELLSAESVLYDVSAGIYNTVNEAKFIIIFMTLVNANISILQATSSISNISYVCNPFSGPPEYQYLTDYCPANTIRVGDIPKVLKSFTCSDAGNGTCRDREFISSNDYKTVEAYTSSIQNILNVYPDMQSLVKCQSVKDAFSEILLKHCKPLKKYVHMVWAALVFLSIIMVGLVLIWSAQADHQQELHSFNGVVKPHSATEEDHPNPTSV
ncbi:hypothetical protein JRO89_XS03G0023600 [Xanthoceras sorbifolium]|uniref:Transmembrane protein n=1 Tax=Xanthoceras sorbifolium TaxID=99658 RepID=A0ABQ8I976_9ROSI|nr:hypothetical protein JRO89_XS03G0023600 [Xanthoceras sorbifolium]